MTTAPSRREGGGLNRWDPFAELSRLNQELRRFLETWEREFPAESAGGITPLGELEEADDEYLLEFELPGIDADDVEVEVTGRRVCVSGEPGEPKETAAKRRAGRHRGRFTFEAVLPGDVDADRATATLREGVLTIRLPKAEARRRRIEVR